MKCLYKSTSVVHIVSMMNDTNNTNTMTKNYDITCSGLEFSKTQVTVGYATEAGKTWMVSKFGFGIASVNISKSNFGKLIDAVQAAGLTIQQ